MRKFVSFSVTILLIAVIVFFTQAQQMSDKAQLGRELFHDSTFKGTLSPDGKKGSD